MVAIQHYYIHRCSIDKLIRYVKITEFNWQSEASFLSPLLDEAQCSGDNLSFRFSDRRGHILLVVSYCANGVHTSGHRVWNDL